MDFLLDYAIVAILALVVIVWISRTWIRKLDRWSEGKSRFWWW